MRSTIFILTLSAMATLCCCEQQQLENQQQPEESIAVKNHQKHLNLSIMLNAMELDMPLSLQNNIAACCSIIREYFAKSTDSFMISSNVQKVYLKRHMKDFVNSVLLNLTMLKVEIESINSPIRNRTINRKHNLLIVDSFESLRDLNPAEYTKHYDVQEYYLIYLMHAIKIPDVFNVLTKIFNYFWDNYIINVSVFMANIQMEVEIYTYFPFDTLLTCKMPVMRMINAYAGSWLLPINTSIFPLKLTNLESCPLVAAVWDTPPYLSYESNADGYYEINYFEGELLKVLANKLNFTLNLQEPKNDEQRGKVWENGTLTGAIKMLHDRTADLSVGSFRYSLDRSQVLTGALPYYQTYQIYAILTTTQLYTPLEMLLYPYDLITWICIFGSFITGMFIAVVIKIYYDDFLIIRIAVGFPPLRTPLTNILRFFTGQPLMELPNTYFARFMIIIWHVYCLLIRTAYQTLLVKLLNSDLYHEPPKSLSDLIEDNCMLVMTEATFDAVRTAPRIENGTIEVMHLQNTSEQSSFFFVEQDQELRCLVAVAPKDFITHHVVKESKRGLFYVLPEAIFTQHVTMYFSKHSYLINRFNELLMNLRSMGMIDFWSQQSMNKDALERISKSSYTPVVVENFEGVWIVCGTLVLLSIITFFIEITIPSLKKRIMRRVKFIKVKKQKTRKLNKK